MLTQTLTEIPLNKLDPSPWNPRRLRESDPHLRELADSIAAVGLKQPILARPLKGGRSKRYQIVAGHRRAKACEIAGLKTVAALVEWLDDVRARELTVLENLQREELHPLEESAGIRTLLEQPLATIESVADRLGKPYSWVARRAKLADLTDKWREETERENSPVALWPASWLEEIAILEPGLQDRIHGAVSDVVSLPVLKRTIANHLQLLRNASWNPSDGELLPSAGACDQCPKRVSQQNYLFPDLHEEGNDRCLDPVCWEKKKAAFVEFRRRELLRESGVPPVEITQNGKPNGRSTIGTNDAISRKCRKGTRGAVRAIYTDGPQAGETIWLKPAAKAKKAQPAEGDKRQDLEYRRKKLAIKLVCDEIAKEDVPPAHDDLCRLLAVFGTGYVYHYSGWDAVKAVDIDLIDQRLWKMVRPHVFNHFHFASPDNVEDLWDAVCELAEMCGDVDPFKCLGQAREELPAEGKTVKQAKAKKGGKN